MAYFLIVFAAVWLSVSSSFAAVNVGGVWGFWGDSQTAGRAAASSLCTSTPECIEAIRPVARISRYTDGLSGRALAASNASYDGYSSKSDLTWVHFQESGNQNETGQTTASAYASTFNTTMINIHTDSPSAVLSYETSFSFGREAEAYRNWDTYNTAMLAQVDALASSGVTVHVADVDATIKALQTALGSPALVWYQTGDTNEYHYTEVGNLMVAVTVWGSLGYDVNNLDLSAITDISTEHKAAIIAAYKSTQPQSPAISSVSGTISHGSSITITGSSFGTHADYNEGGYQWNGTVPLSAKFKDFNDNSITSGGWMNGFSAQNSLISGGRASGYYLREQYISDERTQVQFNMSKTTGEFFISFWFMMPDDTQAGKFWRIYGSSAAQNIYLSTGCTGSTIRGYSECTDSECSPETVWGSSTSIGGGVWRRADIYMNDATSTFTVSVDGVEQFTKNDWVGNPFGGNGHTMDFGNMIDVPGETRCPSNPTFNGSYNYDDIYVSYTRTRVELCTGSTWATKGACEVQVPTVWSPTVTEVAVNTGAFATNDKAYLYVVDSNGEVNTSGYEVTIGGTGTPPSTSAWLTSGGSILTSSGAVITPAQ